MDKQFALARDLWCPPKTIDATEGDGMAGIPVLPVDEHGLIRRSAALSAGWSDAMLASAVRRGELLSLAPGVYTHADAWFRTAEGGDELYRRRSIAAVTGRRSGSSSILSHQSAAAVHDIKLLKPDRRAIHVSRDARSGGGRRSGRQVHAVRMPDSDLVECDGVVVTSMARTAVDVATDGASFAQALTAFDMALAKGVAREELDALLAGRRTRGIHIARRALALSTRLSESVGESWSRAQMIEAGLWLPRLQCTHVVEGHEYRSDFDWQCRLVGEFDGLVKYGRLRKPGETVADAVVREKEREDRLRAAGIMVIRWIWSDLELGTMIPRVLTWLTMFDALPTLGR